MRTKLKSIDLNFENCESGTVPLDAIDYLSISGVTQKRSYSLDALSQTDYKEEKYLACEFFDIILKLDSIKHLATNFYTESSTSPSPLLTHLVTWPDIVDVNLNYQNGKCKNVYLPWKDLRQNELDINNQYQIKNMYKTKLEIVVANNLNTNYGM